MTLKSMILPTLLLCAITRGIAQEPGDGNVNAGPTVRALQDSISEIDEELNILQHFLEASTADPGRLTHTNLRQWTLNNPTLRDSLFYALVAADSSVQSEAGAEAEVLATMSGDLVEVRFGNAVSKGMALKTALAKSGTKNLYEKVAGSYRYSKDVELRDPSFELATNYDPELLAYDDMLNEFSLMGPRGGTPSFGKVDASLYGLCACIGPTWGVEVQIGNDEIGFPFWSSGKTTYLATYKEIKLGFEMPFQGGLNTLELFPPFMIRSRKLNGTRGIAGEFDFGPVGGKFSFTRLTESDTDALTDPDQFYYITGIVQGYFSFGVALTPQNIVRAKIGGGMHRVNEASLATVPTSTPGVSTQQIVAGPYEDIISPYIRFEYANTDFAEHFRISVQYYDLTLLTAGTLDIVPGILTLELKYLWPLASPIPEWQNPEFLMISPHLIISF
jgi:hypothetical protein